MKRKYVSKRGRNTKRARRTYGKKPARRPKKKGGILPVSKLAEVQHHTHAVQETVVSASNTAAVTYGVELGVIPAVTTGGSTAGPKRTSNRVYIPHLNLKVAFFNNAAQEMYIRIAILQLRDGLAASAAQNNPSIVGEYYDAGTDAMTESALSLQNAQNVISMMRPFDKEFVKKVFFNKVIKLGPTNGAGAASACRLINRKVAIGKFFKHETADGTGVSNGKLVLVAAAYDPTNDTASTLSVEATMEVTTTWQDSVN